MNFGIVITDIKQSQPAIELIREALARTWPVRCFLTDDGVNLIKDADFIALAGNELAHFSICEHSVERCCKEVDLNAISDVIIVGGQYQNAELVRNSDRVLVF